MGKPIQDATAVLKTAQREINTLLAEPQHVQNLLEINALFNRIATRFAFMGAVLEPTVNEKIDNQFPPITNFMGEKIELSKPVTAADLQPTSTEMDILKTKVQKLYNALPSMKPDQVLKSYMIPEETIVLRAVAKWAGIKDYETHELTVSFIEDIQMAIAIKEEADGRQKAIDENLKKEQVLHDLREKDPKTLTAEDKEILKANSKIKVSGES